MLTYIIDAHKCKDYFDTTDGRTDFSNHTVWFLISNSSILRCARLVHFRLAQVRLRLGRAKEKGIFLLRCARLALTLLRQIARWLRNIFRNNIKLYTHDARMV